MTSVSSSAPHIVSLSPEEFVQLPSPPRLLDVRTAVEYRAFHAPAALNLSMQRILMSQIPWLRNWALPKWFRELPKDEPLAVICLTAHRSPIAAKALVKAGFSNVLNIEDGMMGWKKADLPTQKNHASQ